MFCHGFVSNASEFRIACLGFSLPGRIASVGLFFYPIYCWAKRNVKFRRDLFSTSSFVKSGAEWATGFCLAVALGLLCTAAEGGSSTTRVRRQSCGPDRRTLRSTDGMQWIVWWCRLEGARQVASALLIACTIAAGIQIYATWHKPCLLYTSDAADDTPCVDL
eukprot:2769067-Amphidinium_carterae.1